MPEGLLGGYLGDEAEEGGESSAVAETLAGADAKATRSRESVGAYSAWSSDIQIEVPEIGVR